MGSQLTPFQNNYADTEQWKQVLKQEFADLRCAAPAFLVEDLNATAQTVTVQIAIQERVRTTKGPKWMDVPPIICVPIVVPRGGGFSITMPLKKGDEGLLVFCDMCFDSWWTSGQSTGGQSSGTQPQFEVRRHHVHDCGFIPGMWSQKRLLSSYSTSSMQLRSDDGTTIVDVALGAVNVTAASVQITSPNVHVNQAGGTPKALVNDNFWQWFVATYMPSVVYVTTPPALPTSPETTVLKGQ